MKRAFATRAYRGRAYAPRGVGGPRAPAELPAMYTRDDPRDATPRGYLSVIPPMPMDVTSPGLISIDPESGL